MLTKEYNWNVKNKASKGYEVSLLVNIIIYLIYKLPPKYSRHQNIVTLLQETYFLVTRAGQGVFYNEIETRCADANSLHGFIIPQ